MGHHFLKKGPCSVTKRGAAARRARGWASGIQCHGVITRNRNTGTPRGTSDQTSRWQSNVCDSPVTRRTRRAPSRSSLEGSLLAKPPCRCPAAAVICRFHGVPCSWSRICRGICQLVLHCHYHHGSFRDGSGPMASLGRGNAMRCRRSLRSAPTLCPLSAKIDTK
jgi:hypothetical protein